MSSRARIEPLAGSARGAEGQEPPRILIEGTMPVINHGAVTFDRVAGQLMTVSSRVYCLNDGPLAVIVRCRPVDSCEGQSFRMHTLGDRHWTAQFRLTTLGEHLFCIDAWIDRYTGFCLALEKALQAKLPVQDLLEEGWARVVDAIETCDGLREPDIITLYQRLLVLSKAQQVELFLNASTLTLMREVQQRDCLTLSPEYPVYVSAQ